MSTSRLVIVAGRGGHLVQAKRLNSLLESANVKSIVVCPDPKLSLVEYSSKEKYSLMWFFELFKSFRWSADNIHRGNDKIVSFGPLFSVPFIIYGYLMKVEVIHIESWSRFTKISLTGRFALFIGVEVFAQNEELAKAYDLICVGRL